MTAGLAPSSCNAISAAVTSGSALSQSPPQSGASVYISHRGLEHGLKPVLRYIPALVKALKNPYCAKTNPEGIIVMTMCENAQMVDEMIAKLATRPLPNPTILHGGDFNGSLDLKEGIRKLIHNEFSTNILLLNHHIHCLGGAGACIIALSKVLFNPGDAALLLTPCYSPFFFDLGAASNVHCVPVSLDFPNFEINFARLDRAFERSIKAGHTPRALVVTNPSNPTGFCLTAADLTKLLGWCRRRNLFYISSEVYGGTCHRDDPADLMDESVPPDAPIDEFLGSGNVGNALSYWMTGCGTSASASWQSSPVSDPRTPGHHESAGSPPPLASSSTISSSSLSSSSGIDFRGHSIYASRFRTNVQANPFVSIIDIAYEEAKAAHPNREVDLTKVLGEDILIIWSASKSLGLSGFRVGATICQNALVHASMTRYSTESQISRETQQTVAFLLNDEKWIRNYFITMRQRIWSCSRLVERELIRLAVPFIRPVGGLSVWIDLGEFIPLFHWKSQEPAPNWGASFPSKHHSWGDEIGDSGRGCRDRKPSCPGGNTTVDGNVNIASSSDRPPHDQLKEAEWLMFETICFTYRVALTPGLDFVPAPRPIAVPKAFQLHGGDDTWVTSAGFMRMCFAAYAAPAIPVAMERLEAFIVDARAVVERMDVLAT